MGKHHCRNHCRNQDHTSSRKGSCSRTSSCSNVWIWIHVLLEAANHQLVSCLFVFVSGFVSFCCVPGQDSSVKEIFYLDGNSHGKISTLWATKLRCDSGSAPPGPRFPFVKVVWVDSIPIVITFFYLRSSVLHSRKSKKKCAVSCFIMPTLQSRSMNAICRHYVC